MQPQVFLGGGQTAGFAGRGLGCTRENRDAEEIRGNCAGTNGCYSTSRRLADQGDSETLQEVVQAYPVEKALPNTGQLDKHGLSHGEWSRICNPK